MTRAPADGAIAGARAATSRREAEDSRLRAALSLIAPSARVDHSGASLWNHLLGTYEILRGWGVCADVCLAGLIHSIYSTQYFRTAIVSSTRRKVIASKVGERAERLAHLFCTVDRQAIREAVLPLHGRKGVSLPRHGSGRTVRISGDTLQALRLIDLANELEQMQREPGPPFAGLGEVCAGFRSIGFVPSHLSADALSIDANGERRLVRHYCKAVRAPGVRAQRLLTRCIAEAPRCAEPRLLLAAAQLTAGDTAAAYRNARAALDDLRGWAAAWDARVSRLAWELMGHQLLEAIRSGTRELPAIAGQIKRRLRRVG